jgi:hypothetical protein
MVVVCAFLYMGIRVGDYYFSPLVVPFIWREIVCYCEFWLYICASLCAFVRDYSMF